MKHLIQYTILILMITITSCATRTQKEPVLTSDVIARVIDQMTEVMIHDITNPPLAARFFSYACLVMMLSINLALHSS